MQLQIQVFQGMVLPALQIKRLKFLSILLCKIDETQSHCMENIWVNQFSSLATDSQLDLGLGIFHMNLLWYRPFYCSCGCLGLLFWLEGESASVSCVLQPLMVALCLAKSISPSTLTSFSAFSVLYNMCNINELQWNLVLKFFFQGINPTEERLPALYCQKHWVPLPNHLTQLF
ncbi:hypothetical protein ATANTOWER_013659 [Ataeniobius toweri]|uniref:Uncharacterized protein n=1 Tax=Ataeniobius toweri TaxID=208326 RepID=A0ABU7B2M3_9TELE|nr:hypothetical protein [Ataeniobius toweri]